MKSKKICSKCKKLVELSNFYKNPKTKDGLSYECKTCSVDRDRKYYQKKKAQMEYEATRPLNNHELALQEAFLAKRNLNA